MIVFIIIAIIFIFMVVIIILAIADFRYMDYFYPFEKINFVIINRIRHAAIIEWVLTILKLHFI